ncbi:uncharacterized protein LOC142225458 [Haematobia irritans]|uniref:uncharacterized protein LOC142225458 n=1 Tax=Haematobia irritans TaxID=7368 RepID=UPI003F4FD985
MKFPLSFVLTLLTFCGLFFAVDAAKRYKFVAAKCMEYNSNHQVDGPLKICTFPPKHTISDDEINAVIQHIKTLKLD